MLHFFGVRTSKCGLLITILPYFHISRYGIPVVLLEYIIKEKNNLSVYNFTIAIANGS
jgi:hypothetical protein